MMLLLPGWATPALPRRATDRTPTDLVHIQGAVTAQQRLAERRQGPRLRVGRIGPTFLGAERLGLRRQERGRLAHLARGRVAPERQPPGVGRLGPRVAAGL